MWIFMRALALHLQICWEVVMGRKFMYGAITIGWGIPIVATVLAFIFSGVSFRFGDTCHINHKNSLADFWVPLLVFCGLTVIIQFSTFGYCIKVYLASLADDSSTTNSSGALPSYTSSVKTVSPKQAYRRVRRVVELQWRGIAIVLLIVTDVIFFAVVFVFLDNTEHVASKSATKALPWIECLIENDGDKTKCFDEASSLTVSESTVVAVLILLSVSSFLQKLEIVLIIIVQWHLAPPSFRPLHYVYRLVRSDQRPRCTNPGICLGGCKNIQYQRLTCVRNVGWQGSCHLPDSKEP